MHRTIHVQNQELSTVLDRLREVGIRLPITGSGRVSASFRVGIPWRHPLTWNAYRLRATLTAPDVIIEGFRLRDVVATANYANGKLRLDKMTVTLWDTKDGRSAGTFTGTAKLDVEPRGDFSAHLAIEGMNAAELSRQLPNLPPIGGGDVTGKFDARAPFERIKQPSAWHVGGQIAIDRLTVADFPAARIATRFRVEGGNLTVDDLTANVAGTELHAIASVKGESPFSFQVELRKVAGRLDDWQAFARRMGVDEAILGTFTARGSARGTLQPLVASVTGSVDLGQLTLREAHVDRLHVEFVGNRQRLRFTRIDARLYEGTANGSASISLDPQLSAGADIIWKGIAVAELLRDILPQVAGTEGMSRGNISVVLPAGKLRSPADWQASGNAVLERGVIERLAVRQASVTFELRNQSLVSSLRTDFAGGRFQATATVGLSGKLATTANFSLQDFELSQLIAKLGLKPGELTGRVNLGGTVQGNLADLAITATGAGTANDSCGLGVRIDAVRFGFAANRFGVAIRDINVQLYGGGAAGAVVLPFETRVAGKIDLTWSGVDIGKAAADLLGSKRLLVPLLSDQSLSARSSGSLSLSLAAGHEFDWRRLSGTSHLDVAPITGLGIQNGRVHADAALDSEILTLSKCSASWNGFRAEGGARVTLAAPFDFAAKLNAQGNFESMPRTVNLPWGNSIAGDFTLRFDIDGSVDPLAVAGNGTVSVREMKVGEARIDSLDVEIVAHQNAIDLSRIEAHLYGGSLAGSAVVPTDQAVAGEGTLHIDQIDFGRLASDLVRLPVRLSGVTTADLQAKIPPGTLDDTQQWELTAKADIPLLHINTLPVGDLHATAECRHDTLVYNASGHLLEGLVTVRGQWSEDHEAAVNAGLIELKQLRLGRLAAAFPRNQKLQGLSGSLDLQLPFTLPAKFAWPEGDGELKARNIRWENIEIANRIDGLLSLRHGILTLARVDGNVAQGILRASGSLDLKQPRRSRMQATLNGINSEQLLAPWPAMKGMLTGPINVDLRGVLASPWRFVATVGVEEGKMMGVALTGFRLPLRIDFDPKTLATEVEANDGGGQFGHGRLQLHFKLRASHAIAVNLGATLTDADLGPLLSSESFGALAAGRVSGTIALAGQNVRSPNDLSGSLQARLRNLQVTALPVFQNLEPYLTGGLASAGSNDGDLRARVGNGILQVEKLTVNTPSGRMYASGRVALAGNLDLGVAVSSYPVPGGALAPALLARLPMAATGPIGLLVTANEFLANRVIYLDVTGTISNPAIRLRPLPILTTEATRFFLGGGL